MPEVGAFGFVESNELRGLRREGSGKRGEFARSTLADFGSAFCADAKVPGIRWEFSLKRGGGGLGGILFGFEKKMHQLRADEIDGGSAKWRAFDKIAENESIFVGAKRNDEAAAPRRFRKSAEVEASDDRESTKRADEKLVKVVAGDVFDDAATAFAEAAGAVNKIGADEEVARGAVRMAKRRVDTGSDDATDGGFEIERNRQREELFLFVEGSGEVVETGSGIHAYGEIAGIVVGNLVEAGHIEGDVVTGRRHADFEFGAIAAGDEGEFFERGKADDFGDLLGSGWFSDGRRSDLVDDVLGPDCRIGNDLRSADGGFEAGGEI